MEAATTASVVKSGARRLIALKYNCQERMKQSADVVIVGGGCMGTSVAYHLAEHGITNVVLVEREPQLGTMSTGRNAGGFRHQFSNAANIELSKESIAV